MGLKQVFYEGKEYRYLNAGTLRGWYGPWNDGSGRIQMMASSELSPVLDRLWHNEYDPDARHGVAGTLQGVPANAPGVKFDDGKPRYDLFPPEAVEPLAELYAMGARKYSDRNWEKGMRWGRVFSAMISHSWKWWRGEEYDPDGQHHLDSVAWCAFALRTYVARGMKAYDDRPKNDSGGSSQTPKAELIREAYNKGDAWTELVRDTPKTYPPGDRIEYLAQEPTERGAVDVLIARGWSVTTPDGLKFSTAKMYRNAGTNASEAYDRWRGPRRN